MKYKVSYRERASQEYLDSLFWYKEKSVYAAENFVEAINQTLDKIAINPTIFRNTYKQFYEARTFKFPFSIVYFIDEEAGTIVVVSIFHFKRNPRKKFIDND